MSKESAELLEALDAVRKTEALETQEQAEAQENWEDAQGVLDYLLKHGECTLEGTKSELARIGLAIVSNKGLARAPEGSKCEEAVIDLQPKRRTLQDLWLDSTSEMLATLKLKKVGVKGKLQVRIVTPKCKSKEAIDPQPAAEIDCADYTTLENDQGELGGLSWN